jgi:aminoglycoside phosphotransferase family enzyme/adenylate kinase family enzyme
MNAAEETWIVQAMSEPSFYDHPVTEVTLIETHISWVFLAGDFAYKVKKPLNLGFLDFSTLAKRRHYCLEELRLNRQLSSHIYLALTLIGGSPQSPVINRAPALEYAVKMRRFPQSCQLDRMLAAGQLHDREVVSFATQIAALHQAAQRAAKDTPYGGPDAVIAPVMENFKQIKSCMKAFDRAEELDSLEQWARIVSAQLKPVMRQRKDDGFVRACHGDVHLANMAWLDDRPLLFDCIEFNDNLRWIDVVNDIAFLVMDLDDREQPALGWSFLNRYLQETGDYHGLTLLNFYKAYRAMVRAKVTCLRLAQGHLGDTECRKTEQLLQTYLDLAEQYTHSQNKPLIVTHGLSGAGKTTFSVKLASHYGAIHIRSDIERKRMHGLAATADSQSAPGGGIYNAKAFVETYQRLRDLAKVALRAGLPVLADATFIKSNQRTLFRQLAEELHVPLVILDFQLTEEVLRHRILQRARDEKTDASEATLEVLDYQLEHREPLNEAEQQHAVKIGIKTTLDDVLVALRGRMV